MSWRIIILPNAEADLRQAQLWYDLRRDGLGDDFFAEVEHAVQRVIENPDRRPVYYDGFRLVITRRFPYKLFYRVENDRVVFFRILHVKMDHRRHL